MRPSRFLHSAEGGEKKKEGDRPAQPNPHPLIPLPRLPPPPPLTSALPHSRCHHSPAPVHSCCRRSPAPSPSAAATTGALPHSWRSPPLLSSPHALPTTGDLLAPDRAAGPDLLQAQIWHAHSAASAWGRHGQGALAVAPQPRTWRTVLNQVGAAATSTPNNPNPSLAMATEQVGGAAQVATF